MLFKWKGANKKSHQKWDFIVNLVLWLVKQRVTWPFSGDFWRKTTTNHHEPPRNHHRNHHKPPRSTTNHHEPPQSLIQNEIWYWILDSDWLNSGSHDIFLRILEKKYHEPPQTTTNHKPPQPLRTTTKHYEPQTTNHHKPSWSLIQNEIWYWILDSDWLNSGSHDIILRILEKNYHEPLTNHHKPLTNHHKPRITNHHKPSRSLIQNEIWYWILDSDWLNSGSHDIILRPPWNITNSPQIFTNHHETSQIIIKHHESLWTTTKHHEPPWTTPCFD